MYRFLRVLLCLAAIGFAVTGVYRILHADGEWTRVAHGALRIGFAAFVFTGAVRGAVRGRPEEPTAEPPPSADDPGP